MIIRVFIRKTSATPDDDNVRINTGPGLFDVADEVHISVLFTWDMKRAEELAYQWERVAPVKIGGPATGDTGNVFIPGMYVKKGFLIHHRGCPNKCWFCIEKKTPICELEVSPAWNDLSSNLLACSDDHFLKVMNAMKQGEKIYKRKAQFTGGLEAKRLTAFHINELSKLKPEQMFFAYDCQDDLEPLVDAGKRLISAGFKHVRDSGRVLRCYVLCGFAGDTTELAEQRMLETMRAGFMPMAMVYRYKDGRKPDCWARWQRNWTRPAIMSARLKSGDIIL